MAQIAARDDQVVFRFGVALPEQMEELYHSRSDPAADSRMRTGRMTWIGGIVSGFSVPRRPCYRE
jgi:hypothetical protein